jgi:hypothetical protein
VPADSIEFMDYTETFRFSGRNSVYYEIGCTIVVCENVKDQALDALEASMQKNTYDVALSNCLNSNATVIGSFTTPQRNAVFEPKPTRITMSWPMKSPTPMPTQLVESGENYCAFVNANLVRNLPLLCL